MPWENGIRSAERTSISWGQRLYEALPPSVYVYRLIVSFNTYFLSL